MRLFRTCGRLVAALAVVFALAVVPACSPKTTKPQRRSAERVFVMGFDGSDDAIQSIVAGELKATSLQPVAEMAIQAVTQADLFIKNGGTDKPEKQSIDMVLQTQQTPHIRRQTRSSGRPTTCLVTSKSQRQRPRTHTVE